MPTIDLMGIENAKHGVCGFTSVLYAVYTNKPELRFRLAKDLGGAWRSTRIMAEIKTFLMMMKAEKNTKILNDIIKFNRECSHHSHWNIDLFINMVNDAVEDLKIHPRYKFGMPPEALRVYMQRVWGLKSLLFNEEVGSEAILGLTSFGGEFSKIRNSWDNLAHYVYQNPQGKIYTWGQEYVSLHDLCMSTNELFDVVCSIKLCGRTLSAHNDIANQYILRVRKYT